MQIEYPSFPKDGGKYIQGTYDLEDFDDLPDKKIFGWVVCTQLVAAEKYSEKIEALKVAKRCRDKCKACDQNAKISVVEVTFKEIKF